MPTFRGTKGKSICGVGELRPLKDPGDAFSCLGVRMVLDRGAAFLKVRACLGNSLPKSIRQGLSCNSHDQIVLGASGVLGDNVMAPGHNASVSAALKSLRPNTCSGSAEEEHS